MRKYVLAGVVLALTALVAACGGSGKGQSGSVASNGTTASSQTYPEFRWGETPFPGPIDWDDNLWGQVGQIEALVVQNLVTFEPNGKLKLGLASSVENPNPTTYIYHVRSGIKFSDGKLLTIADVAYSLTHDWTGKESVVKSFWEDVSSVSTRDNAVVVKLKRPEAVWPEALAFSSQIVEKAQAEKIGEKAMGTPSGLLIGTGPWKFDSFTPESNVQLSRNPYWTGPQPPASKISIDLFKSQSSMALALRSGAIDGATDYESPRLFAGIPNTRPLGGTLEWTDYLAMGTTSPPLNDVHVRRAIAYATDTSGMVKALLPPGEAIPGKTMAPPPLFANFNAKQVSEMYASLPKYEFNLAAAKQELAKSAYPHGFATEIQVLATASLLVSAAQILSADLAKIGITAKVHELQLDEARNLFGNKVKLSLNEFGSVYSDPDGLIGLLFSPKQTGLGGLNTASYKNSEIDNTLLPEEQADVTDPTRRLQLVTKILGLVGTEVPYLPLFEHGSYATLSNKYVFPFSIWTQTYAPWALDVKLAK